jgi:hypothetical protein
VDADEKGGALKGYLPEGETSATPISNRAWIERSGVERRSGKDKRRSSSRAYFLGGGIERRQHHDRRQNGERRERWLRIGTWHSVSVFDSGV